ncbi:3-keto-5-aminohexanoate cleavage protein, partial [Klebsiella pneumoniae]|nr:3-keto-5-aminohexanoate cleavage protein [Klebsiella pneumoniae]
VAAAYTLGAHVRCGFEDGVQIRRGQLAKDNAEQVTKAARIIDDLGGELATPDEARAILGLKS